MELVFYGIWAALLLFLFVVASGIPGQTIKGDIITASGFPMAIILLALLLLTILVIGYYNKCKKEGKSVLSGIDINKNVLANVGVVAGYIALMNIVGFCISTLLFTFFNARIMGYRKIKVLVVFAIILTASLVVVFGKLFYIPLPRGMGILRDLSYYVY